MYRIVWNVQNSIVMEQGLNLTQRRLVILDKLIPFLRPQFPQVQVRAWMNEQRAFKLKA